MVLEQVSPKLRDEIEVPHRWSKVKGPISAAIATSWDHRFEPKSHTAWIDPQGWCWHLDYQLPNFVAALREILTYHVQRSVWTEAAPEHLAPLGGCPDISAFKVLAEQYNRE